jgi:hypothetical protein
MSIAKKKTAGKVLKKKTPTVVVMESRMSAKDTLFPKKVAEAKKILRKARFYDSRFGS